MRIDTIKNVLAAALLLMSTAVVVAQENSVSVGGDIAGVNGSVSFSVGQIDYTYISGTNGNINEGVQQPFSGGCADTDSSFAVARCSSYTVPSGDETYSTTGVYMDTIPNALGCDSVLTISVYIGEVPTITNYTSVTSDKFKVHWEYSLPVTVNDTNFRIRTWEQGFPGVFTDKSQFPGSFNKIFDDLDPFTWYETKVGFACADGSFIWSAVDSVRTRKEICATPTGMAQSLPLLPNHATLTWDDQGATQYKLRFRLSGTSSWSYRSIVSPTKTIAGLMEDTTYEYQVKALCTTGLWSAYTSIQNFSTIADCPFPENETQVLPLQPYNATLTWDDDADEYRVRFRLNGTTDWSFRTVSVNSLTIGGLTPGSLYDYQVKAFCAPSSWTYYATPSTFQTAPLFGGGEFERIAQNEELYLNLYPNPASDLVNLQAEGSPEFAIKIVDGFGRTVFSESLESGNHELNLSAMAAGVYTLIATPRSNSETLERTKLKLIIR